MIEIRNVTKRFGNVLVLKNISLTLPNFGLVIINGPSGCGKTTLLNILSTLLDFEGEISFDGTFYSRFDEDQKEQIRSQKIGFVYQDYKLFEFETVKENISLSIDISCGDTISKKNKRVNDLLRLVNLSRKENELVAHLSGGEKQRVSIARALANSPKVLLADEPTGNLDEYNTKIVMELLQKISTSSLVIMVSHDLSLSKEYADQIIEMEDGSWCAIEIKLGANQIEEAANNLKRINNLIIKQGGNSAKSLCVICGLTNAAYKRNDGVYVVPITSLKD